MILHLIIENPLWVYMYNGGAVEQIILHSRVNIKIMT